MLTFFFLKKKKVLKCWSLSLFFLMLGVKCFHFHILPLLNKDPAGIVDIVLKKPLQRAQDFTQLPREQEGHFVALWAWNLKILDRNINNWIFPM